MLLFITPTNLFLCFGKDYLIPVKCIVKCHLVSLKADSEMELSQQEVCWGGLLGFIP